MNETTSRPRIKRIVLRFFFAALLLAAAGLYTQYRDAVLQPDAYDITVIPPTCLESGYSLYANLRTGATEIRDTVSALGHSYGPWGPASTADTPLAPAVSTRLCQVCGAEDTMTEYPRQGLPVVAITGDLSAIGKKTEVPISVSLYLDELETDCFGTLKHQGHSTLIYDKKNFTLKLFLDEDRTEKNRLTLEQWNPENKYILKANYADPSQCRNLVCADIWADMTAARDPVPAELTTLSHYGAVDGFPIALYINGSFHGLYTWNLHKDDDLFGMKDGQQQAMMIVNHTDGDEAFFRAEPAFGDETPWEVEYCGTEDAGWAKEHLAELIHFVRTADDDAFRRDLSRYLDTDSAVDYLIAMYALGLPEHAAKDLLLVCYGPDDPWLCSLYDMEEAFDGTEILPTPTGGGWDSGTGSLLWDRFLTAFYPEICTRYAALRQTVLDPDSLCDRTAQFIAAIPQQVYDADAAVNGTSPHTSAATETILNNIRLQIAATDRIFSKEGN